MLPSSRIIVSSTTNLLSLPSPITQKISARLLLSLITIAGDYAIAPSLYNGSTLWATAALLLLILRRGQATYPDTETPKLVGLSIARIAIFLVLHAAIILAGRLYSASLISASTNDALPSAAQSAAKLLILLPTAILFTRHEWPKILRRYNHEFQAATIVLLTFFPYRLFHTIWPQYSQLIATAAYQAAKPFTPGLALIPYPIPTIAGPQLNLQIVFWCSGFSALAVFDTLIALIALLDWNELNHKRLLIAYTAGAAAILAANILRISLLVIVGNEIAPKYATGKFHINTGWLLFGAVYALFLTLTYRWMLTSSAAGPGGIRRPQR